MAAAKAKSTEVYGLVSKDLGEVGNQVGSAAGSVGQQVGSAAGAVKKTLEVNGGTLVCFSRAKAHNISMVVETNLSLSFSLFLTVSITCTSQFDWYYAACGSGSDSLPTYLYTGDPDWMYVPEAHSGEDVINDEFGSDDEVVY